MKLSVIIPCYNEAQTIGEIIQRVHHAALPAEVLREIIVVNDGSDAATREALEQAAAQYPVRVIWRDKNGGKGAAVKNGLEAATGEYCLIQDADLEYDPGDYAALLAPVLHGRTQVVFGARQVQDNNVPGRFRFYLGGKAINWCFNVAFKTRLTDLSTCYKLFPRTLVPQILTQPSNDFVFDVIELSYVLARHTRAHGTSILEVPIRYHARSSLQGKKLRPSDGMRCLLRIITLRLGHHARLARFFIVGGSAALLNLFVIYLCTSVFGLWYLASSVISFTVALVYNFSLQKLWTFDAAGSGYTRQFSLFASVSAMNLLFNTILMYTFVDLLGFWYLVAQLLTSFILAFESYFLYKHIFA